MDEFELFGLIKLPRRLDPKNENRWPPPTAPFWSAFASAAIFNSWIKFPFTISGSLFKKLLRSCFPTPELFANKNEFLFIARSTTFFDVSFLLEESFNEFKNLFVDFFDLVMFPEMPWYVLCVLKTGFKIVGLSKVNCRWTNSTDSIVSLFYEI